MNFFRVFNNTSLKELNFYWLLLYSTLYFIELCSRARIMKTVINYINNN